MPDKWELLKNKIDTEIEVVSDTLDSDDMINVEILIGKLHGLELALDLMTEVEEAVQDFEDTVSGSGG